MGGSTEGFLETDLYTEVCETRKALLLEVYHSPLIGWSLLFPWNSRLLERIVPRGLGACMAEKPRRRIRGHCVFGLAEGGDEKAASTTRTWGINLPL